MKPAPVTLDHFRHFPFGRPTRFDPPAAGGPEDCVSVEAILERLPEGNRIRIPWQLEDGDLEALQRGEHVWLTIWGGGMPPVDVQVHRLLEVQQGGEVASP